MTPRTRTLTLLPVLAAAVAGCGYAERARENAESVGQASAVNCVTERETFQLAMESYLILEAKAVAVETDMVPRYLRTLSPLWDIDAAGNIVPQPGGGCE